MLYAKYDTINVNHTYNYNKQLELQLAWNLKCAAGLAICFCMHVYK